MEGALAGPHSPSPKDPRSARSSADPSADSGMCERTAGRLQPFSDLMRLTAAKVPAIRNVQSIIVSLMPRPSTA